ncbi:LOW QUALITY PROTEIN: subtilisin-like protease SBT4.14 [Selaginella moellendorffii]|uniref:LOW QUALITY PROTEIN: subtilisin-like protease SBT4.14 n=1 Tax=Selaginella moellendorffii TaxID=88036 RepID=UPI000D1C82A2|nr:LOW QUALITY PROTEIN: subtilisin-like protease SBT4.14 [Selaginella moellendorffii]|eukprot:XP_024515308.1 LOW QUALITY PROTEIN: subtilisin-like protease SBT4.14 [Selaginella moellendorffii]
MIELLTRKLVGARYYNGAKVSTGPYKNSRDSVGHGTHTSSTAAGSLVPHASKRGLAPGTARGGAPNARIAMYKVCWTDSCEEVDIAAGFDDAINDGVDVLSISLGGYPAVYSVDVIAIGAYHAVERGIMVSCAGGNSGPFTGSVSNGAPWIFTVGASTIDREINEDAKIAAKGTTIPYKPAPVVAEFSSRGPHTISPDIIKVLKRHTMKLVTYLALQPDVTAPGVEILAAWPSNIPDTDNGKEVFVEYTFLSGTSMACPHVSGTIAYLKSIHPTWSPAAIKSAVMTTGKSRENKIKLETQECSWQLSPKTTPTKQSSIQALTRQRLFSTLETVRSNQQKQSPGLVYDTDPLDYITYLCNSGYTSKQIQNITGDSSSKCPKNDTSFSLNYPSIAVLLDGSSKTVERTVTNVGNPSATYTASVGSAKGISISQQAELHKRRTEADLQRHRLRQGIHNGGSPSAEMEASRISPGKMECTLCAARSP